MLFWESSELAGLMSGDECFRVLSPDAVLSMADASFSMGMSIPILASRRAQSGWIRELPHGYARQPKTSHGEPGPCLAAGVGYTWHMGYTVIGGFGGGVSLSVHREGPWYELEPRAVADDGSGEGSGRGACD